MTPTVKRTEKEINEVLNECDDNINDGKRKFRGMGYEDGVVAGIRWVLGDEDVNPMQD